MQYALNKQVKIYFENTAYHKYMPCIICIYIHT